MTIRSLPPGPMVARRSAGGTSSASLAVLFAVFPILFVISAALNPLGTLVVHRRSSRPALQPGQLQSSCLTTRPARSRWFLNSLLVVRGGRPSCRSSAARWPPTPSPGCGSPGRRGGLLALLLIQMFPQFLAIVAIFLDVHRRSASCTRRSGSEHAAGDCWCSTGRRARA